MTTSSLADTCDRITLTSESEVSRYSTEHHFAYLFDPYSITWRVDVVHPVHSGRELYRGYYY